VSRDRHVRIFVLIDALGWSLLQSREFLSDILPFRRPLRTVLGFSSGAIPTILTGLKPAENGHWNLFYYDPEGSPFRWLRYLTFIPRPILDHRIARRLLRELGRRVLGLGPLFECCVRPSLLHSFNWVEKRNIYDRGGINGARSIFDELAYQKTVHRVYSYHHGTDQQILDNARHDLVSTDAEFFFLYLSELDSLLHFEPKGGNQLETRLGWYAENLRKLFELARERDPGMTLSIFSDHGMAPVNDHYDLVRDIDALGLKMGQDYLAVYDSTMARFWFFVERAREVIAGHLETLRCGRILTDAELTQLGVFFDDRRYGEAVFLLNPGCMIAESDFNGGGWVPLGMHGYHPDDPDSDAVFLSNITPRVAMKSIADVYQCMLESV
jgi:predicted AlkP superfamily pyrophosphatase or phosphodiesterase